MAERSEQLLKFADFTVDLTRRRLMRNGEPLALTAKAFDTLSVLIRNPGETVDKADLMNAVWGDTSVEENNLTQQISALRKTLGEHPRDHRFIVTVPGHGYSFVASVDGAAEQVIDEPVSNTIFDAGALRGYVVAAAYIFLVALSFLFQGHRLPGRPQSLAVLDFKTSSSGDEFIGSGISDTLRARLGSVQDLVIRPSSVAAEQDAILAGRNLNVEAVVTGSVQRDQDRIRVAVQMVDVDDGRIIWGKTFDDAAENIFALQDSISGEVAKALNVALARRWPRNENPFAPKWDLL